MAAGKLSGYSDNNRNTNGNRDYERSWNGTREARVNPGKNRARQKDTNEKDVVNGWYQSNLSRSESGSSSGGSDGHGRRRNEYIEAVDREPGELSSESVSDGATESEGHIREEEVKYFENRDKQSPVMGYKRKFTPIVWDRDEENGSRRTVKTRISPVSGSLPLPTTQSSKRISPHMDVDKGVQLSRDRDCKTIGPSQVLGKAVLPGPRVSTGSDSAKGESDSRRVKTRVSPVTGSLPLSTTQSSKRTSPHPDLDKGVELSHAKDSNTTGPSPGKGPHVSTGIESSTSTGQSTLPPMEEAHQLAMEGRPDNNQGTLAVDDDEYVSTRTINASRWANDADSPADEGEILEYESMTKSKIKGHVAESSEKVGLRKSMTPEFREPKREGLDGNKMRSSDEQLRSSGRDRYTDDLDKNDSMKIDVDRDYGATLVSVSDNDSDDENDSDGSQESAIPPTRSVNMLQGCRNVDEFERLNKIDEGTYGVVYRAKDRKTGEIVALKKVKMEKEREGFPLTSLREMNILLSFHHPSIVDVKEVVVGSNLDSIFMVMEYMEHDLKGLMETMKQPFSQSEVKCLMLQLLGGIKYLHDNWVLHRDLKTSNLLLNNRGELKICDFGLARQYGSPLKPYTHLVVTLWYRAPELLLGSKQYSTAIDMWSLGCIMAELLSKEPLFNGKTEFDQLGKIFKTLGMPNETIWPGFSKLPGVKGNFVKHQLPALGDLVWLSGLDRYNMLRKKFPATSFTGSPVLSDKGFDLLNRLLTYDPEKRITAEEALDHAWFREVPLPKTKEFMPTFPAQHAQDRRSRRVMKSPDPLEEQRRKELQQGGLGTGGLFG